ncbi:AGE family epimerase/isomerase [Yoonia sp. I 8.24]|uniref:AGE family epimerase/isomerase n=1 Tax=Yoonia sp. I 8.24 TaxID=1537229 RepID=UPI001EDE727D|nr:AGE family epimerase/isomerase [Yoonia sp. I 8.24]MCG3268277.1 AGE family epimerase/isomerase [Yoonia sp. I 8.24]
MKRPLCNQDGAHQHWLQDTVHRSYLEADAQRQCDFFRPSVRSGGGFYVIDLDGAPLDSTLQELHTTARMVHSFALGQMAGFAGCAAVVDHGLKYLNSHHRDAKFGGYVWALDGDDIHDGRKLAYGHVFVLLAASSAHMAGHPDALALIDDVTQVLETKFWEDDHGLFADEWNRDWTPFSTYRGMNANMHGVEALLTAYEATGRTAYLDKAGRILDFFVGQIAPANKWRLAEHYTQDWQIDWAYSENPMFRPAGTTPGHSFELARLSLQYWDLRGRPAGGVVNAARNLMQAALDDAWDPERGGLIYTLNHDGTPAIKDRYWWPVTEAIGVLATLIKLDPTPDDETWYRKLWQFADSHFIDHTRGGWYPEIDVTGAPTDAQFKGKPDIYHAVQASLFALAPGISNMAKPAT